MKTSLVAFDPNGQSCLDCAVRSSSICAALDGDEIRAFGHLGRHIHFSSGETVFAQEDMTASFYNLLEGVMRLYKLLPDGRRQIVGFALPGDFLGVAASSHHGFSADAIGAVTVCRFSRASFERFVEDKPYMLRRINELTVRELNRARDHMVLLGRRSAEEKVASFLIGWRDRLSQPKGSSATVDLPINLPIDLPMSRLDIADYLGLTIETVSRTFTRLNVKVCSTSCRVASCCAIHPAPRLWPRPEARELQEFSSRILILVKEPRLSAANILSHCKGGRSRCHLMQ